MVQQNTALAKAIAVILFAANCDGFMLKKLFPKILVDPVALDSAQLILKPKLRIERAPESKTVIAGSSVSLECAAFGTPLPVIEWFKDGKRIKQGWAEDVPNIIEKADNYGRRVYDQGGTTGVLKLDNVSPNEAGTYTCTASNGYKTKTVVASLDVVKAEKSTEVAEGQKRGGNGSPAHIYMYTDTRIEREGATVQLLCRASGSPQPAISWQDENGELIRNDDYYQVSSIGDLVIKNANFETSVKYTGGGYKCIASNPFGSDSADAFFYPTKYDGEDKLQ